ncbi:putative lipoprotein [Vibrio coralliirubri]|uniref:hypothetical protein n=1 Tax=Vibrio coralliirubri TaxID=1516159 RepID=UPI000630334E|nr:hypothetical protein [Vibrio coralliirubri]CDT53427.1 putative lipoprotein [Vibrio coralliirubri]
MKKLSLIAVAIGSIALAGCATVTPMQNTFAPSDVEWSQEEGDATVRGQAFLRTVGGEVKTCAGYQIDMVPVSPYSEERISIIYGNTVKGFRSTSPFSAGGTPPQAPAEFLNYNLVSVCDATGSFEFEDVPAGEYFIVSGITWQVSSDSIVPEGGTLMQRIKVKSASNKKYIMSM